MPKKLPQLRFEPRTPTFLSFYIIIHLYVHFIVNICFSMSKSIDFVSMYYYTYYYYYYFHPSRIFIVTFFTFNPTSAITTFAYMYKGISYFF